MNITVIEGRFLEEAKNRFLCTVLINDVPEECYVPSSTRLSNFFDLSNVPVLLTNNDSINTRTKYKLLAVYIDNEWILVNLNLLNALFYDYYLSNNADATIFREKKINDDYKADLLAYKNNKALLFEVKGLLSKESSTVFPSITGERAIKQLRFFKRILKTQEYEITYVIVLLSNCITEIKINRQEKVFTRLFKDCVARGMNVVFYRSVVEGNSITLQHDNKIFYR